MLLGLNNRNRSDVCIRICNKHRHDRGFLLHGIKEKIVRNEMLITNITVSVADAFWPLQGREKQLSMDHGLRRPSYILL